MTAADRPPRCAPPARRAGHPRPDRSPTTTPGCGRPTTRSSSPTSSSRTPGRRPQHGRPGTPPGRARRRSWPPRCRTRTCRRPVARGPAGSTGAAGRPARSTSSTYAAAPARTTAGDVAGRERARVQGHDFVELGVCEPSPDGRLLAYSVDHDGARGLRAAGPRPDHRSRPARRLTGTYYGIGLGRGLRQPPLHTLDDAYRPDRVRHHVLGTAQADDGVAWHEDDRRFELEVDRDPQRRAAPSSPPAAGTPPRCGWCRSPTSASAPRSVAGRVPGREYFVDHEPGAGVPTAAGWSS